MSAAKVIVVLGAESTGKTTLVREMVAALRSRGLDAVGVPEALRLFCERTQRTPLAHEQAALAEEQTRLIDEAASRHAIVLADTSALMTAVYSQVIFRDDSLFEPALRAHGRCDLTLLTALDLPWVPDGHQRDGPHVREPVDAHIREALMQAGLAHAVVMGQGVQRVAHALSVVEHLLDAPARAQRAAAAPRWRWFCENCDDGECEQHWLTRSAPRGEA